MTVNRASISRWSTTVKHAPYKGGGLRLTVDPLRGPDRKAADGIAEPLR